jgi:hypothetical protein
MQATGTFETGNGMATSRARFLLIPNRSDQARTLRTRRRTRIGQADDGSDDPDAENQDLGPADVSSDDTAPDAFSQQVSDFTDLFAGSTAPSGLSVSTGNSLVQDADSDADSISADFSSVLGPTGTSGGGTGLGPAASTTSSSMSTSPAIPSPLSLFSSVPTWAWIVGAVVVAGVVAAVIQKTGPRAATA